MADIGRSTLNPNRHADRRTAWTTARKAETALSLARLARRFCARAGGAASVALAVCDTRNR